ncbi:penicillin acylase family protein [Bowmanella denitrificans]|uniref:penicillin acylase family protein n=1 Tax=Bowmanella denitrificans TaxID=366582 RepID=UPI001558DBE2|nr:penicillin acylase family protein [Bowmanella denitrificans]
MTKTVAGCAWLLALTVWGATAQETTLNLEGLKQQAGIRIDNWGIAHIQAQSQEDAFFVQGFNVARDRLWQLDLWRRKGLGKLSAVFGADFVEMDRASRLFLFRGDIHQEWQYYGQDSQMILQRFVQGINAYISLIHSEQQPLPKEFQWLGYMPEPWQAEDILKIRSHGLSRNLSSEVTRALTLNQLGNEAESLRQKLTPAHSLQIPQGSDYQHLSAEVLRDYQLATGAVRFSREDATDLATFRRQLLTQLRDVQSLPLQRHLGSNAWALAPQKSHTGRAILASDPHRVNTLPSGRYAVHIKAPGLDVIGAGEPYVPGISVGHNGQIAFGFTIFSADQEDLYHYVTDEAKRYRYRGGWRSLKVIREQIEIKDADAMEVELAYTRHGPVIYHDQANNQLYAVRAAWLQAGMVPYLGSLHYQRADNIQHYLQALRHFANPAENHVYADVQGNIGRRSAGRVPLRLNWDGLLPVPGEGRYEWLGHIPHFLLPWQHNPKKGWVASANEMNLPAHYPLHLGYEWPGPHRYDRLAEKLSAPGKLSLQDMASLQNDQLSLPARRILALYDSDDFINAVARQRWQQMRDWDKHLNPDSHIAAFFELWWNRHMRPAMIGQLVGQESFELLADLSSVGDQEQLLDMLELAASGQGQIPPALVLAWLSQSLQSAHQYMLNSGLENVTWGQLHGADFTHPISPLLPPELQDWVNVGPVRALGGSGDTVRANMHAVNYTGNFNTVLGPSWSMVVDVGQWDNSLMINSPGQSGNIDSPFYRDLFEPWASGQKVPLLYSDAAVAQHTQQVLRLLPSE